MAFSLPQTASIWNYNCTTVFSTIQFKSPGVYFLLGKLPQICHTHPCTFTHTDQCVIAHTKTSIETQRQKLRPWQCLWLLASPQQKGWSHTQLAGVANWSWIWWLMDRWTCPQCPKECPPPTLAQFSVWDQNLPKWAPTSLARWCRALENIVLVLIHVGTAFWPHPLWYV